MKALSTAYGMWCAVLGACLITILVIGLSSRLSVLTSRSLSNTPTESWEHWVLMVLLVGAASCLAAAPCIRFLADGWKCRLDEFKNSIHGDAVHHYLEQFWATQLNEQPQARVNPLVAEALFAKLYVSYNGRRAFAAPVLLFLAITFVSVTLLAQTGVDTCIAPAPPSPHASPWIRSGNRRRVPVRGGRRNPVRSPVHLERIRRILVCAQAAARRTHGTCLRSGCQSVRCRPSIVRPRRISY